MAVSFGGREDEIVGISGRYRGRISLAHPLAVGEIRACPLRATGTGSDVWKRIAAPMVGGILTSFVLELVVYPAIYEIWKWHFELKRVRAEA